MDDPRQRIAELEQQLAQQKRIAELERQLAEAKAAAGPNQAIERPAPVSAAQMEAIDAGGTIKVGSQVVFSRCDPSDPVFLEPGVRTAYAAPSRGRGGAGWIGPVIAMLGRVIGLCVGGAAA